MFKALRMPETWFKLLMWAVSFLLAGFLIGLGGKLIGDLPQVEQGLTQEQFADAAALGTARKALERLEGELQAQQAEREKAALVLKAAANAYQAERTTFGNWLATRSVTTDPQQDPQVIDRTRALDALKAAERSAQQAVEAIDRQMLDNRQARQAHEADRDRAMQAAEAAYQAALRRQELRVFGLRLALTLPLLVLAGWLVARQRASAHWPLLRGFVLFAAFAFFVELVPYLPSYGGYVRYGVGVALTALAGHHAIAAMRRWLHARAQRQQQAEGERRQALAPELALKKLAAKVCPGCERALHANGERAADWCVHCGLRLFAPCGGCGARRNLFYRHCPDCGAGEVEQSAPPQPAPAHP